MLSKPVTLFNQPAIQFLCPGCDTKHTVSILDPKGPSLATPRPIFNGNHDKPSLSSPARIGKCHFKLVNGRIHFFGDSTHKLRGASVNLKSIE